MASSTGCLLIVCHLTDYRAIEAAICLCLTARQKSAVLSMSMLIKFVIEMYCTVGLGRHDTQGKGKLHACVYCLLGRYSLSSQLRHTPHSGDLSAIYKILALHLSSPRKHILEIRIEDDKRLTSY
jgi:hypothetical protein